MSFMKNSRLPLRVAERRAERERSECARKERVSSVAKSRRRVRDHVNRIEKGRKRTSRHPR